MNYKSIHFPCFRYEEGGVTFAYNENVSISVERQSGTVAAPFCRTGDLAVQGLEEDE